MSSYLCISVRFLQPLCHGRGDGGEPEWPPSPLRLFQALVAGAAGRWNERTRLEHAVPALRWLECHPAPTIVAASGVAAEEKYRLYVPDNIGDLAAGAWTRGDTARLVRRTEKDVRPTRLLGDAVSYLYPLSNGHCPHFETLRTAVHAITHLGWGIDMVVADAVMVTDDDVAKLSGERWLPGEGGSATGYRMPINGTLDALMAKHEAGLNRLGPDGFKPIPPLAAFRIVRYRRATEPVHRPFAAFGILKPDASGWRPFDPVRRTRDVAAWVRHATGKVCTGWPLADVAAFVHGHDVGGKPLKGPEADHRFAYLPLPTINGPMNRVELIRRVVVVAPPDRREHVDWVRRRLPGQDLSPLNGDGRSIGMLNLLPGSDWVLNRYVGEGRVWSTVTPVVWPGHDDRNARKADGILRKAFVQAGLAPEVVAAIEELDWRPVGFRAGLDLAQRYVTPDKINGRRYHVRVRFAHTVRGPLAVGAGRYRGMGTFALE